MNEERKAKEETGGSGEKLGREGKRKGRDIRLEAGWKRKAPGSGSQRKEGLESVADVGGQERDGVREGERSRGRPVEFVEHP